MSPHGVPWDEYKITFTDEGYATIARILDNVRARKAARLLAEREAAKAAERQTPPEATA